MRPSSFAPGDRPRLAGDLELVGRAADAERAAAALDQGARLLTLRGPPGVGKSALARALARRLGEGGRGAPVVNASSLARRAELLDALARALSTPVSTRDARVMLERVAHALEAQRATVFIDGIDGAFGELRAVIADLLDATDGARLVVTSWRALGLPGEHVQRVAPLTTAESAALLTRALARHHAPSAPTIAEETALLRHAGGLPLALEVLAARVAALGAPAVLGELERHGLSGEALDRVLDAAWAALEAPERGALAALGVVVGPCTPSAAEAVVGAPRALEALERLCASSLVQSTAEGGAVSLSLLDAVRTYAVRQARALDLEDAARARHADHFARAQRPPIDDGAAWAALVRERGDLLAAWRWARARGDRSRALALAVRLDPLLVTQGPAALHHAVLEETVALLARAEPLAEEARAHAVDVRLALARHHALRGAHRRALAELAVARADADALGDLGRAGWAHAFTTFSVGHLGALDEAALHAERALAAAHARRDLRLVAMAEQALGVAHLIAGDAGRAEAGFHRAQAAASLAGAPRLHGIAWANLALAERARGALDASARALAEARATFTAIDDRFHLARVAAHEGELAVARGAEDAETRVVAALDQTLALDDREGELCARAALVELARRRGDHALWRHRHEALALLIAHVDDVSWPRRWAALAAPASSPRGAPSPRLRLTRDGRAVELGGRRLDFSRRGPLRRVLLALVEAHLSEAGRALTAHAVREAGWPGEKMLPESAAARVYMAIRRLRELGLEPLLHTREEGYALEPSLIAEWIREDAQM